MDDIVDFIITNVGTEAITLLGLLTESCRDRNSNSVDHVRRGEDGCRFKDGRPLNGGVVETSTNCIANWRY